MICRYCRAILTKEEEAEVAIIVACERCKEITREKDLGRIEE